MRKTQVKQPVTVSRPVGGIPPGMRSVENETVAWNSIRAPDSMRSVHHSPARSYGQWESVKVLQKRLGHTSDTMTLNVYGHLLPMTRTERVAPWMRCWDRLCLWHTNGLHN